MLEIGPTSRFDKIQYTVQGGDVVLQYNSYGTQNLNVKFPPNQSVHVEGVRLNATSNPIGPGAPVITVKYDFY